MPKKRGMILSSAYAVGQLVGFALVALLVVSAIRAARNKTL